MREKELLAARIDILPRVYEETDFFNNSGEALTFILSQWKRKESRCAVIDAEAQFWGNQVGAMEIYLSQDGERIGPFSLEEVNRRLATGTLSPHDIGWSESSPGWKPLLSFAGVIVPGGASSTPMPISMATPVPFGLPEFAGFWIRAAAFLIDALVLGTVLFAITLALKRPLEGEAGPSALAVLLKLAAIVLYMPTLWASPMQATIGQKICGLKVIPVIGGRMSFSRGIVRMVAMLFSGLIAGLGYIMIAFTERKRGLHDILSGTYVVKDL